jgi:hypothetical protein
MNIQGPGMREFKVMDKQNREKTVSITGARIPDTNRILVSLMDITGYKKTREELKRILTHSRQLMVEMEKAAKDLHG